MVTRQSRKIRFIKPYGLNAVGDIITPQPFDIARILVMRGVATWVKEDKDPDGDGKDEGGIFGIKKAFSAPPAGKSGKKK